MATVKQDIEAVKEWLSSEVRLDRYADKLESNGYTSLELCCTLNENALDKMEIVLPYHRKRFLMYAEKLREKLGLGLTNGEDRVTRSTGLTSHGPETGNEQQSPLINFDNEALSRRSSQSADDITSEDVSAPMLPPKKKGSVKLPPPIPPRADLEEVEGSDQRSRGEDILTQDPHQQGQQLQQSEIPPKKIPPPVKPPRRTTVKKQSPENTAEDISKTDEHTYTQEQHAISGGHANNAAAVNTSEEGDALLQCNSTSVIPQLPKPEEDSKEVTSGEEVNKEKTMPQRPAPKAPERAPSSRPTPKPRTRVKSEDNKLVVDLLTKSAAGNVSEGDFSDHPNNTIEKRTNSFSTPGNRRIDSSEEKPSTMPRPASMKRPAPPVPPSRQSGSVFGREPAVKVKGENEHQQQPGKACLFLDLKNRNPFLLRLHSVWKSLVIECSMLGMMASFDYKNQNPLLQSVSYAN